MYVSVWKKIFWYEKQKSRILFCNILVKQTRILEFFSYFGKLGIVPEAEIKSKSQGERFRVYLLIVLKQCLKICKAWHSNNMNFAGLKSCDMAYHFCKLATTPLEILATGSLSTILIKYWRLWLVGQMDVRGRECPYFATSSQRKLKTCGNFFKKSKKKI